MQAKGLARVNRLYESRGQRAVELSSQGKTIIGYFCCYTPVELITAAGLVPYRVRGRVDRPVSRADAYLETIACSYVRSCLEIALNGEYSFLDGIVMPHTCDNVRNLYEIWTYNLTPGYAHFINCPHMTDQSSYEFFKEELSVFKKSLEELTNTRISNKRLVEAVRLHNRNRLLARKIYELRKHDPPLLSGAEMTRLAVASMSLPVIESNALLEEVLKEIGGRERHSRPGSVRILLYGGEIDDASLVELIEESGGSVVMDDYCFGSRFFWHDVDIGTDILASLVDRYMKVPCPRTYRSRTGTFEADLENRFGYIKDFANEYGAKGVISYIIRYCDTFEFDLPGLKDYLQKAGLPVLHIEDEYLLLSTGQLKTRIQAFLETII